MVIPIGDLIESHALIINCHCHIAAERLHDFNIGLTQCDPWVIAPAPGNYDVLTHEVGPVAAGATVTYSYDVCPLPTGRYLVIQIIAPSEYLTVCEVTVSGKPGVSLQ